jgi:hypothetical protein
LIDSNIVLFAADSGADDPPLWGKILIIALALLVFGSLLFGLVLVIRDSVRRRGRWGINGSPTFCPNCGEATPTVRKPASFQQALWGGCMCKECGCEFDKWGRRIHCPKCAAKLPEVSRPKRSAEENSVRGICSGCGHQSTLFRLSPSQYDDV